MNIKHLMQPWRACWILSFGISVSVHSKIIIIDDNQNAPAYELPRSKIKTYLQKGSLEQNLKPVKAAKPGALSDVELVAIPERYLPPELKKRQQEIKKRLKDSEKSKVAAKPAPSLRQSQISLPGQDSDTVRVKTRQNKIVSLKIENAVWVPPTSATDDAILAPEIKLPEVKLLSAIEITTSGEVKKEIESGDPREMQELFEKGQTQDLSKKELLEAYQAYNSRDYATSTTLALAVYSEAKTQPELRLHARFLAAHSLFRAGFYSSAMPFLMELVSSPYRRSAIGMIAKCLEKTKDESAANQVLARVSISQIPESYQPVFSFHLGRILMNTGAREPALSAFNKVPADHNRYAESQYFMGVIRAAEVESQVSENEWEDPQSWVYAARAHFETALTAARAAELKGDLLNLVRISMARLAYQAKQYHQALFYYSEVETQSPFSREALYESAWALYKIGEFNRTLGMLHSLNSEYFEARDLAELWILRSMAYLKLCRFDEAKKASEEFESQMMLNVPVLEKFAKEAQKMDLKKPEDIKTVEMAPWLLNVFMQDSVVQKDFTSEMLLSLERDRLKNLSLNPVVKDQELKDSAYAALSKQLDRKIAAVGKALKPYLIGRASDIVSEYRAQKDRLDFLKFEIYSQAQKFPTALERPEAQKQIQAAEFLPGVFLKGHEILWRFSGEYWYDELRSYDYFIPTECKSDLN